MDGLQEKRKAMLYIHGKGGSAEEAAQFSPFCAGLPLESPSVVNLIRVVKAGEVAQGK